MLRLFQEGGRTLQLESYWTVPNVYWLLCLYGSSGPPFKNEDCFYTPDFEVVNGFSLSW